MTAPLLADGKPVYATYEEAAAAEARQERDHGIATGIIRAGGGWQLRFDINARCPS